MKKILNFAIDDDTDLQIKERIFFHDLINSTHGLLLYLGQKHADNTQVDIQLLINEITNLQLIIKDNYGLNHKNIKNQSGYYPFSQFENSFRLMLNLYFGADVNVKTEYRGKIAVYENETVKNALFVHFPSLYRIMNNIIKNMHEANATSVYFSFDYTEDHLVIECRNNVNKKTDYIPDLNALCDREKSGILSINEIVWSLGGSFQFYTEDFEWINKISIPHQNFKQNAA
jgi:glucose-6-phosphate-specific signal transduction histidine kinase